MATPTDSREGTLADLRHRIADVRAKERRLTAATGVCRAVVALIGVVLGYFLLDWLFDLPYGARLLGALGGLALVAYVVHRYLIQALRRVEDDDEVALRVEARNPELRGRLISTLQLAREKDAGTYICSAELLLALEAETLRMAEPLDFTQILSTRTLVRVGIITALIVVVKLALLARFPDYFTALAARLVHPHAQFPTRTHIQNIKTPVFVARGDDIPVEVTLDPAGEVPRVPGVLNFQGRNRDTVPVELLPAGGTVFKGALAKALDDVELVVAIGDARSEPRTIRVLLRPEIDTAASGDAVSYTLPAYAHERVPPQKFGPLSALAGSTADIRIVATKPLAAARLELADGRAFALTRQPDGPRVWALAGLPMDKSGTFHVSLLDTDGLANSHPPLEYTLDARPDLPPVIKLVRPSRDLTVTSTARPVIGYNARDDYGLRVVWLVYRIQAEGQDEGSGAAQRVEINSEKTRELLNATFTWDLSALTVKAGDQVVFWLECDDACTLNDNAPAQKKREAENATPAPAETSQPVYPRSQDLKFTVVSRQVKLAELEAEVERLVQQIERAKDSQEDLKARVRDLLEQIQKLKAGS